MHGGKRADALPTGGSFDSQDSSTDGPDAPSESTVPTCTVSISCAAILENLDRLNAEKADLIPADGVLLAPTAVEFTEGESVFDVLKRVCRENKIHMEFSETPVYQSAYIEGIGNLYEFDCGEGSGWMYRVNGEFPNYGCSRYTLADGDTVEWVYTCDFGADVGGRARRMKHHAFLACHPAVNLLYFRTGADVFHVLPAPPLHCRLALCRALVRRAVKRRRGGAVQRAAGSRRRRCWPRW